MEDVFLLIKWSEFGDLPGGPVVESVPAKAGTQVQSLDFEDPLEKGMATHSSILAWDNSTDRGAWQATIPGVRKSWMQLSN